MTFVGNYVSTPKDYVFWLFAIFFVLVTLSYFLKRDWYRKLGRKLRKVPILGKLGNRALPALLFISAFVMASPLNSFTGVWIWDYNFQNITPQNMDSSGSHTVYNGEQAWYGMNIKFTIYPGYDHEDNYAATTYDNVSWDAYRGAPSMEYSYNEQLFLNGQIGWQEYMEIQGLTRIDGGAASTRVCTSTIPSFNSGETIYIMLGDGDAAADENDPLKSMIYKVVVQGQAGTTAPTTLSVGTGLFAFYGICDINGDMTVTLKDENSVAITGTSEDWSDQTSKRFEWTIHMAFATVEYNIQSYFNPKTGRWWNFYLVFQFKEHNTTALCDTMENIDLAVQGGLVSWSEVQPGATATSGGVVNFVIQLTNPHIYTNNDPQAEYSYTESAAGHVVEPSTHVLRMTCDLSACTEAGAVDDSQEFKFDIDMCTEWLLDALLSRGTGRVDNAPEEPMVVNGAATYYIVV